MKVKLQRSVRLPFFRKERKKAVPKKKIKIQISDKDKEAIEKLNASYRDRIYPQPLEEDLPTLEEPPQSLEEITEYINHVALLEE